MLSGDFLGVLLAGGKSTRFGSNKALAVLAGRQLIEHPAEIMAELFAERLLITNTPADYAFLDWPMTGDIYPDAGPLAGIHAAFRSSAKPLIFVAGCDMPFLDRTLVSYLCSLAGKYDVVIPRTARGLEPLHAVYRRSVTAVIENNLAGGNRKVHKILAELKVREVDEDEMLAITDSLISFRNINTITDLENQDG